MNGQKRTLCIVTIIFFLNLFIGIGSAATVINGNWVVNGNEVRSNEEIILHGNLNIQNGASLTLDNVLLEMNGTSDGQCSITVQQGGKLYTRNNSKVTGNFPYYFKNYGYLNLQNSTVNRCYSIYFYDSSDDSSVINGSVIKDNKEHGIYLAFASPSITNCIIKNISSGYGIRLHESSSLIENNTLSNLDTGIYSYSDNGSLIKNNTISNITSIGIYIYYPSNNNIVSIQNNVVTNSSTGLLFSGIQTSSPVLIEKNTFSNNERYGIYSSNYLNGTQYKNNIISNNGLAGFYIVSFVGSIQIVGNIIENSDENVLAGVSGRNADAYFADNLIRNNEMYGILTGGVNCSINNSTISGSQRGIASTLPNNIIISNSTMNNLLYDYSFNTGTFKSMNTTFGKSKVYISSSGLLDVYWHETVEVLSNSVPVSGALVQVFDKDLNKVAERTSGENGKIAFNIREYTQKSNSKTFATPHKINASKPGFSDGSIESHIDESKTDTIVLTQLIPPQYPVANFSSNVTEGYPPLSVQFTDFSQNTTSWNWDFGDGDYSTEQNPTHTYNSVGTYTVTMTAINENGTNSKFATISVSEKPEQGDNYSYVTKWGSQGSGEGEFNSLTGIAIDSLGNVYVADRDNCRIQKFNSNGDFILQWDSQDIGDGQLFYPYGIAIDSSDNIYFTDTVNNCVKGFNSTGDLILQWGSEGSGDKQFNSPTGIAIDSSNNIYITDTGNNRIQKLNSNGEFILQLGSQVSSDYQFNSPTGVAIDSLGNIYVADTGNNCIKEFDSTGEFIFQLGSPDSLQWWSPSGVGGHFGCPSGIAIDSSDNIYVTDNYYRIQKFDSGCTFITQWGFYGSGNGQFNSVNGVAVDSSGNVYATDWGNYRIQKFAVGPDPVSEPLPIGNFSINVSEGYAPLLVQFTDLSENAIGVYWDFGDGNISSIFGVVDSKDRSAIHEYTAPGTYIVNLVAVNVYGIDSKLATIDVSEKPVPTLPVANFSTNISEGYAPLSVQFTDLSENTTEVSWDFDSNGVIDSTDRNPIHEYVAPGTYSVNLTAANDNGTNSKSIVLIVLEKSAPVLPVANFSSDVTSGYAPLDVQFTDSSENAKGWNWDFGDGATSTEQNPVHTYLSAGTYDVNLTVTNAEESDSDVRIGYITVLVQDVTKPIIQSVVLFPVNTTAGSKIDVTVNATDNIGITEVKAGNVQLKKEDDGLWRGNITAPSVPGSYSLSINASDAAGNNAEGTANYRVVTSSGSLGAGVSPKTTTALTSGKTIDYVFKIKSTQNFDDTILVNVTMEGLPESYQIPLGWFDWNTQTVKVVSNSTVSLPLKLTIPPGQSVGRKAFKVKANSTTWPITAYDSGVITIS